jgi:hypothetical protein
VGVIAIGFTSFDTNWRAQDSDWPLITLDLTQTSLNDVVREKLFVALIFSILFAIVLFLRVKSVITLLNYSFTFIAGSLLLFQMTPPLVDAIKSPNWSFVKSNIASTTNIFNNCGMAEYLNSSSNTSLSLKELIKNNAISPEMIYLNPCEKLIDLRQGVWQEPKYGVGPVTVLDQQRLAFGTQIEKIACLQDGDDSKFERYCYYKWDTSVPYLISY